MIFLLLGGIFLWLGPRVLIADPTTESLQRYLQFFSIASDQFHVMWQPPKVYGRPLVSPKTTAQMFWEAIRRRRWQAEDKIVITFPPPAYGGWMELRSINPETQTMLCTGNVQPDPSAKIILDAIGCRWKPSWEP
jgi:hypothetical protein